jgi:hypothetical protein
MTSPGTQNGTTRAQFFFGEIAIPSPRKKRQHVSEFFSFKKRKSS